ncbi:M23 family metallopeptidase [Geomonas anaerohicana]|uniref:M23 family metallopeptidase n=1 Tax=Geomonas anaerohicana TaxID=2798583 RepID=A0ABS0YE71_9BACT|nr:M23 family metallopeptidase [Geomonas anaerohicana]MBJ6750590.1 M23 family metallopeptidase [Geomonas anaerohicana]
MQAKYYRLMMACSLMALAGCAGGLSNSRGSWPWEYDGDYGKARTGNYIGLSGAVAKFGDPPAATPKAAVSYSISSGLVAEEKSATPERAAVSTGYLPGEATPAKNRKLYDFTVRDVKNVPPTYLPQGTADTTHAITAVNNGTAPVSVVLEIDRERSENLKLDTEVPLYAVVPPKSEQVLFLAKPEQKGASYRARYAYSWGIGVYNARHDCPEHYRFPFSSDIKGYALVAEGDEHAPERFAITFSMPAGTTIVAARKGVVSRIKENNSVDILHDDATIATYEHIGKIGKDITEGKAVAAGAPLGVLKPMGQSDDAYLRFVVWRPEPQPAQGGAAQPLSRSFTSVSFPVEFCTGTGQCSVLTKNQPVPFAPPGKSKPRGKS